MSEDQPDGVLLLPNQLPEPNRPSPKPSPSTASTVTTSLTARLRIPTTYTTLPAQWLATYQSFVRNNASQVSSLESTLSSLTYLIPGTRVADTPITSESLHTFISLITAYNTHLLASPPFSPQRRYERFWAAKSKLYARSMALLRTIQYTQLLLEMLAKRAGEKARWRVIVLLEIIKATCRLCMSRVSGSRPVIATGIGDERTERRVDAPQPASATEEEEEGEYSSTVGTRESESEWKMPRTGMRLPLKLPTSTSSCSSSSSAEESRESITAFLTSRTISADDIKPPPRLVHTLNSLPGHLSEYLYILRPVIYALALAQYQRHSNKDKTTRSWPPWLLGLTLDVLSRHLYQTHLSNSIAGGAHALSSVEKEECKRRGWSTMWWLMRGAFYEKVTREWVVKGAVARRLKGVPLLGDVVGGVVEDWDFLWGEWYFGSATL